MLRFLKNFFTRNVGLKITAFIITLALWFYIVDELHKGSEEEQQFLDRVLPSDGLISKKLSIRPIFIGKPRYGFNMDDKKAVISPEYCIVVGSKNLLNKIKFAYTRPIDISGANKPVVRSIALNPIAPGVYTEETLVQVTVPIEKSAQ